MQFAEDFDKEEIVPPKDGLFNIISGTIYLSSGEERILQLCDGTYFLYKTVGSSPIEISESDALKIQKELHMTPITITG